MRVYLIDSFIACGPVVHDSNDSKPCSTCTISKNVLTYNKREIINNNNVNTIWIQNFESNQKRIAKKKTNNPFKTNTEMCSITAVVDRWYFVRRPVCGRNKMKRNILLTPFINITITANKINEMVNKIGKHTRLQRKKKEKTAQFPTYSCIANRYSARLNAIVP